MRARRVRFTKPGIRQDHPRATKTRDGVTQYRHSNAGRHAKLEAMAEQRRRQGSLCARCNQYLDFSDSKFENTKFMDGVENKLIHKRACHNVE
jgi:hypothetical protein